MSDNKVAVLPSPTVQPAPAAEPATAKAGVPTPTVALARGSPPTDSTSPDGKTLELRRKAERNAGRTKAPSARPAAPTRQHGGQATDSLAALKQLPAWQQLGNPQKALLTKLATDSRRGEPLRAMVANRAFKALDEAEQKALLEHVATFQDTVFFAQPPKVQQTFLKAFRPADAERGDALVAVLTNAKHLSRPEQARILEHVAAHPAAASGVARMLESLRQVTPDERPELLGAIIHVSQAPDEIVTALKDLLDSAAFANTPADERRSLLALIRSEAVPTFLAGLAAEMRHPLVRVGTPNLLAIAVECQVKADPGLRDAVAPMLAALESTGLTRSHLGPFITHFKAVPNRMPLYAKLLDDPGFKKLGAAHKEAIMAQACNYGDSDTSLAFLQRLAMTPWFVELKNSGDIQRSAKLIASFGRQVDRAPDKWQPELLRNTADKVLAPRGTIMVQWASLDERTGGHMTEAMVCINREWLQPGLDALDSRRLDPVGTLVHEVNHALNRDDTAATFRYFMGEYGAWYEGVRAKHGRAPSRQECFNRARYLLTGGGRPLDASGNLVRLKIDRGNGESVEKREPYDSIADALRGTRSEFGVGRKIPNAEAEQIIRFMGQFFAEPPSPTDPASALAVINKGHIVPNGDRPGPQPVGRDRSNAGTIKPDRYPPHRHD